MPKHFNFGTSVKLSRPSQRDSEKELLEKVSALNTLEPKETEQIKKESSVEVKLDFETKKKTSDKEETRLNGFRLPIGLDHMLESYAYHEGINKTDIVIEALKNYFKNKKVELIPTKKRKKK